METEIKILKFMLLDDRKPRTIREISIKIKADYKIVHTASKRLVEKKLLKETRIGKSILLELTGKFSKEIFEAEYQRREELLKNKNFRLIFQALEEPNFQFVALIFGSYAKGKASDRSDIDLMIISEKEKERAIENLLSNFSLNIHLLFFSYEEFLQMKNSKELSVVSEALKNNIILINIEDYYRLLKC